MSKTDFSSEFRVARKTQQVASWSRVQSRDLRYFEKFYASARIDFIVNFVDMFDADITANDFYIITDYSLPGYDLR